MGVQLGQRLDRYSIEELVGEGGMGRVYRAYDTRLQRPVALKVLHDIAAEEAGAVTFALREARAAAAIAHPNATAVYDAHEVEGTSFIVMEFVSGTSLRALIDGASATMGPQAAPNPGPAGPARIPLPTRIRWLIDTAAALAAAHRTGVVHRDVKPENVMVRNDGLVKVLDFGVARFTLIEPRHDGGRPPIPPGPAGANATNPSGARIAGTPAYMSPEQIRGEEIDGRADQFGWGVLAYELLTGHLPWRTAKDVVGYIAAVVTEHPAPPSAFAPEIPAAIDAAILRALSKRPEDRFPSILAAAAELAPYARASLSMPVIDVPPEAPPAPAPVRADDADGDGSRLSPPPGEAAPSSPRVPSSEARVRDGRRETPGRGGAATLQTGAAQARITPSSAVRMSPFASPTDRGDRGSSPSSPWPPPAERISPVPADAPPSLTPAQIQARLPPAHAQLRAAQAARRASAAALNIAPAPLSVPLRAPQPDAQVDVEGHLALLPQDATCKGLFAIDVLHQVARVALERDVVAMARIPERRYIAFRDYPLADQMRLAVAAARLIYPRCAQGEGLRRLGHTAFDAVLGTHVGRSIFGVLSRDVEPILLAGPKAFGLMTSVGHVTAEKTGPRTFLFQAREMPLFLETYQVGVLEGVLHHCGARGRVRIAVEGLAHATLELTLI